jgi:hypothetical protein
MSSTFILIAVLLLVAGLVAVLRKPFGEFMIMRGQRVIACPENTEPAAVTVDAGHAAISALRGFRDLKLEQCSRWPEKAGCGQECLRQIEASPVDCLVRTQVALWYVGKSCALCGKSLAGLDWTRHAPAVMAPDTSTSEWRDIKPETLRAVMATHKPICWDCHVSETFRRTRPDLVIDNPFSPQPR